MKKDLSKILITLLLPSAFITNAFGQAPTIAVGSSDGMSKTLDVSYTIGEAVVGYSDDGYKDAKFIVANGYEFGFSAMRHIIEYYVADKLYARDTFYTGDIIIPTKEPYISHDTAFIGWDNILPEYMPGTDLFYNAIVDERTYEFQLADNFCPGDTINIALSSNQAPYDAESYTLQSIGPDSFPLITNRRLRHKDGLAIASFILPEDYKGGHKVPAKMTVTYRDGYKREMEVVEMNIGYNKNNLHIKVDNMLAVGDLGEPVYSYQWQKDGEDISGETNKYFQDINGLRGSYNVIVGTDEGLKTVCPQSLYYVASDKKGFASGNVIVNHGQEFEIVLDGFTADEVKKGTLIVFDYKGSLALPPITDMHQTVNLKLDHPGVYAVAFILGKYKKYTTKVIVK
ncbi:MAG: hypothetical protein MJZ00_08850 [Paludibacteraceae bacterium]|nr:hypothetical protein [Paludibacteraceae bacterium]